ncbi:MAG: hypothetical protein O9340_16010 [Cyclobacteriaceae bacterium]|jgi:hypothetical protein|nr:hypothetical protein [Cyclobacteriaceae bacterium]
MGNAMKRFTEEIDLKLRTMANKMNAKVSKDRSEYPQALVTFEERRIDWIEDNINKAIIFQPNFESKGVNEEKWNFGVAAWFFEGTTDLRFSEELVKEQHFESIANQLDKLLTDAAGRLSKINMIELDRLNNERLKLYK